MKGFQDDEEKFQLENTLTFNKYNSDGDDSRFIEVASPLMKISRNSSDIKMKNFDYTILSARK